MDIADTAQKLRDAKRKRAERARAKLAGGTCDEADRLRLEAVIAEYERVLADESASAPSASAVQPLAAHPPADVPISPAPADASASSAAAPSASAPSALPLPPELMQLAGMPVDQASKVIVALADKNAVRFLGPVMALDPDEREALAAVLAPVLREQDLSRLKPTEVLIGTMVFMYGPRLLVLLRERRAAAMAAEAGHA